MSRGSSSFYARLQAAADLLSTGVVVLDRYARVLWCNTAAEMLIGCSRRNLKGTDIGLLITHVREWAERFSDKDKKLVPYTAVTELRRPLAEPEPVQIMLSSIAESESSVLLEIVPVQKAMDSVRQEQEAGMGEATRSLLRNLAHEVKIRSAAFEAPRSFWKPSSTIVSNANIPKSLFPKPIDCRGWLIDCCNPIAESLIWLKSICTKCSSACVIW